MTISLPLRLFDCHAIHFFEAREAVSDLLESCATKIPHPFLRRLLGNIHGVAARHDDAAELLAELHDLVDADAALVAVGAGAATLGSVDLDAVDDVGVLEAFLAQR